MEKSAGVSYRSIIASVGLLTMNSVGDRRFRDPAVSRPDKFDPLDRQPLKTWLGSTYLLHYGHRWNHRPKVPFACTTQSFACAHGLLPCRDRREAQTIRVRESPLQKGEASPRTTPPKLVLVFRPMVPPLAARDQLKYSSMTGCWSCEPIAGRTFLD